MRLAGSAGDREGKSRERKPKMLSEGEAKGLRILQEGGRGGGLHKTPQGTIFTYQGGPIPMRGGVKAAENKTSPGWTFTSLVKAVRLSALLRVQVRQEGSRAQP